uniref:J domain-containing protein n=1 Tax=Mola mola TaxID=94237 RepID=A0A3Q3X9W4_MOLML
LTTGNIFFNNRKDLYAVLGASSSDSAQQLRHRYQQLVLQYHPDRVRGQGSSESAVKKFLELDAAWRILRDESSRRQYDMQLRERQLKQDWPVDSTVCLEDMSWDEGDCTPLQRRPKDDEEEETDEEKQRGVVVCCDTCSLSLYVIT